MKFVEDADVTGASCGTQTVECAQCVAAASDTVVVIETLGLAHVAVQRTRHHDDAISVTLRVELLVWAVL